MKKIDKIRAVLHGIGIVVSALSAGIAALVAGGDPAAASLAGATIGTVAAGLGEFAKGVV